MEDPFVKISPRQLTQIQSSQLPTILISFPHMRGLYTYVGTDRYEDQLPLKLVLVDVFEVLLLSLDQSLAEVMVVT